LPKDWQPQYRAVAHAPACGEQAIVACAGITKGCTRKARRDLLVPDRQQSLHQPQPLLACRRFARLPIEHGRSKCRDVEWIRHLVAISGVGPVVFSPPSLADGAGKLALKIAKEGKRRFRSPFFAHEQHWRHRRQQGDGKRCLDRSGIGDALEPVAERAVADLVVILQEIDKGRR
jgi:hypothetical protein